MSDEIRVRITLDKSALLAPTTRVDVQIPEVARAEYLLPASRFEGLKDRAWPEVLDEALEHAAQGWAKASPAASARLRIAEWLRVPGHRDEVQAAFEVDHARRHPVGRKLLAEIERLRARVDEVERAYTFDTAELKRRIDELLAERHSTNESLTLAAEALRENRDRIAELEALKPATSQTCRKCGAGYTYGEPCSTCLFKALMAAEVAERASREEPRDSPLHHDYRVPRDLPPLDGAR